MIRAVSEIEGDFSSDNAFLLWRLAHNPNTRREALVMFAEFPNDGVQFNVAGNPSTPPETLMLLAGDARDAVRQAVVDNPNSPEEAKVLAALLGTTAT